MSLPDICDPAHKLRACGVSLSSSFESDSIFSSGGDVMNTMRAMAISISIFALTACTDGALAPLPNAPVRPTMARGPVNGTGLVLNSITGVTVPLIGQLGSITIDQAIITDLGLVENAVGQIVGLEATGILQLSGDVLGAGATEDFTTAVGIISSGPGQCDLVTIDLGQIDISVPGVTAIDVPAATLAGRGSGAVGSLLCNLGNLLGALTGGGVGNPGAQGVVNALNNQI
jgi:hypothetical protein